MSARLQLVAGPRDLTAAYSDLTFSNVDPGGFEQLQVTASDARGVEVGDEVTVRSGLDVAWHGRVNEIGSRERDRRATVQIAAVGYGAKLSDKRMQMIYADRDLTHWEPSAQARRITQIEAGKDLTDASAKADASGNPALAMENDASKIPACEAVYRAPVSAPIAAIYYAWQRAANSTNASWQWRAAIMELDYVGGVLTVTADLQNEPNATGSGYLTAGTPEPYGWLEFSWTAASIADPGAIYALWWTLLTVYGNHGLTRRGTDPGGFYPGDIAGHAHTLSGAGFEQVFGDSSTLTVRHAVYREPVRHEQVIADMTKLMGWHYGVWEPATILGTTPRLFFTAPPAAPTCVIDRSQIADLDAPRVRVDRLYDTAKVAYQDPSGTSGVQTVTIVNPLTASAGVSGRTLDIDMGQGDSTTATTYGTFALNLALAGARGGGSGTVPDTIASTSGGRRPACLLRSGRDRIRITDLPDSGSWTETDANRQDSFLVRRVETTVKGGQPSTRIEFDGGADLLDVLNARLALAQATGSAV